MNHKLKYLSDYLEESRYLKDLNDRKLTKNSIIITARYRTGSTYLSELWFQECEAKCDNLIEQMLF